MQSTIERTTTNRAAPAIIFENQKYRKRCFNKAQKNRSSLVFYSIGGLYRFCGRLQHYHKSNQTCIIIDTLTYKYQIKSKDPDCRIFKPSWKEISDLNK
jgi:hypothetical protein